MKTFIRAVLTCCIAFVCAFALPSSAADHLTPSGAPGTGNASVPAEGQAAADTEPESGTQSSGHSSPVDMYMQTDPAWSGYLYGGQDPMSAYGCGPAALAIAVSSLTDTDVTPVDAARWSAANGHFSPGRGSVHSLIPAGARNYGLKVERLSTPTPDNLRMILSIDKLIVLLMGPGDFSDAGHFIIAYGYDSSGNILIADPASTERSAIPWPAETLIEQLSSTAKNGGPVWIISKP